METKMAGAGHTEQLSPTLGIVFADDVDHMMRFTPSETSHHAPNGHFFSAILGLVGGGGGYRGVSP